MSEFAVGDIGVGRNRFVVMSRATAGSPWRAICNTHAQINAQLIADALATSRTAERSAAILPQPVSSRR